MDDGSIFGDAAGENNAALNGRRVHILPVKRIHHVVQDAIASHVFRDGTPTQSTGIEPHHQSAAIGHVHVHRVCRCSGTGRVHAGFNRRQRRRRPLPEWEGLQKEVFATEVSRFDQGHAFTEPVG